ncbi:MAG: AAA-like domain-containing protein [Pseudacidovorax sp.]|uniref:AAA-like domain-containing protein n=1 Tax=Pseudacidovorax sp. TaxID=1934311 RepID=UPI001B582373|nr:AAA-like domain-containing protein [Pseudacidovorax sp.]MBP6893879.1 AAA-like domain-containing protein [Pseudacidovorax sp.]
MQKQLRSFTIIPPSLYVERQADRQVAAILNDMGRPGYVLVARQMGKTNLILNSRRSLSRPEDLFAYLDVSNLIPDLRSFFRNIVDVCLEHPIFENQALAAQISSLRLNNRLLAHKEHELELSLLVKHIPGKLVICLDEIDALIGSNYSDQVFSFIRSVYFSGRANFEEFGRITYLLSGVAEPSDIIKNKDVSPFNIGAKIFLEDFERDEVETFLRRAGLQFSTEVVDRLFFWTSGHPRMTWDICSALEDVQLANSTPKPATVDEIVGRLYFGDIELPPVDQIKRAAIESREVRDALISMHYNRGSTVADSIKTKLYLAGISLSGANGRAPNFKNKIFEEALSEEFLQNALPDSFDSKVELIAKLYMTGEHQRSLFELEALRESSPDSEKLWFIHLWTARSLISLGRYEEAAEALEASRALDDSGEIQKQFFLGTALFRAGLFRKAETSLERAAELISVDKPGGYEVRVDLARCILKTGSKPKSVIEGICKSVVAAQDRVLNSSTLFKSAASTLVEAHIVLAELAKAREQNDAARAELEYAERLSSGAVKLKVFAAQLESTKNIIQRKFILNKAVAVLAEVKKFSLADMESSVVCSAEIVYKMLFELEKAQMMDLFTKVIAHLVAHVEEGEFMDVFSHLSGLANTSGNLRLASGILEGMVSASPEDAPSAQRRDLLGLLLSLDPSMIAKYGDELVELFDGSEIGVPSSHNLFALLSVFLGGPNRQVVKSSAVAGDLIFTQLADEADLSNTMRASLTLLREFVSSKRELRRGKDSAFLSRARAVIANLQNFRNFDLPFFSSNIHKSFASELLADLASMSEGLGRREARKIGRNMIVVVRYGERLVRGKYKFLMADLDMGLCELVSVEGKKT